MLLLSIHDSLIVSFSLITLYFFASLTSILYKMTINFYVYDAIHFDHNIRLSHSSNVLIASSVYIYYYLIVDYLLQLPHVETIVK